MRKSFSYVTALTAAAFLSMSASTMAFAQGPSGWVEEDSAWHYYDGEGYMVTDAWKKLDGSWYYLDSDGEIAKEQKVDDFYVNSDGVMVTNQWVRLSEEIDWDSPDTPEAYWFYFGEDGKVTLDKWLQIDGSWYYFNEEGHLMTGKFTVDEDTYYTNEDGVMQKGWVALKEESGAPSVKETWYFFDNNGKMVKNHTDKKIGDHYYTFVDGKMQTGWAKISESEGETATIDNYQYYDNSGKRADGWVQTEGIAGIHDKGQESWFFFKEGKAMHSKAGLQIMTAAGKRHCFNEKGEMQTGLQWVSTGENTSARYYFGSDGVLRLGKQSIYNEDLDLNQTWLFYTDGEKKGQGVYGIRDNNIYLHGLRQDAESSARYASVALDGKNYLVNTQGAIQKALSTSKSSAKPELGAGFKDFKDNNDTVFTVDVNGIIQ